MTIQLDPNISQKLDQGMAGGGAIELPFPTVYLWAHNGQAAFKSQGGPLYYGGWACKAADLSALVQGQGIDVPSGWTLSTIATRDGEEFEAYLTRSVLVAPIGKRVSWLFDGRRYPRYTEGSRRHVQTLVYLSERSGENGKVQYVPWGPVVLTAKGYQGGHLLGAFLSWDKATTAARLKYARGVPAWCFYLALGTFGKERKVQNVGKAGAQSSITPIETYLPKEIDEKLLQQLFVGEEVAAIMADLSDQAQEWLHAWDTPEGEVAAATLNDGAGPDNWPASDEVPF